MKKLSLIFLPLLFISMAIMAQDDVKRPKDIGVSDYDKFKNNSFNIKDESKSLKNNVLQIDKEIKNYAGVINTIGVEKLRTNLKALRESGAALKALREKIGNLDDQAKALLEGAKSLKPRTKSPAATKNTNQAVKGLKVAKGDLQVVSDLLEEDVKLLTDELKSRGEPIE